MTSHKRSHPEAKTGEIGATRSAQECQIAMMCLAIVLTREGEPEKGSEKKETSGEREGEKEEQSLGDIACG